MQKVSVIGAGAWGTALAQVAVRAGRDVTLWCRREEQAEAINIRHENPEYLPDITLEDRVYATTDLREAAQDADAVFLVVPAQHMRSVIKELPPILKGPEVPLVICSKGIEMATGMLMSGLVKEFFPEHPFAVLSGPNLAHEVAKGLPAAATLATSADKKIGLALAETVSSKTFRPYVTSDPIGAEIGGAVKNVIAIACGIVYGCDLGENARAAIMTRGMAEIKRMGKALGAKPETFLGLSGMGDLTLTCSSMSSRNFSLGVLRGKGRTLNEILAKRKSVTEGVPTATAVLEFAKKHAVDMPICAAVNDTLHKGITVDETIEALMTRPLTQENI